LVIGTGYALDRTLDHWPLRFAAKSGILLVSGFSILRFIEPNVGTLFMQFVRRRSRRR
jgi:hypothetical protein